MSKLKPVRVNWHEAWIWDNSLDIVLAHIVEVAESDASVSEELLRSWRVHASVPDLMFTYPREDDVDSETMALLVAAARERVSEMGDVTPDMLTGWSVCDDLEVSGGFLRGGELPVDALLEVVDWLAQALAGEPEWEFGATVGAPNSRMRRRP